MSRRDQKLASSVLCVSKLDIDNPMSHRFEAMRNIGLEVTGVDWAESSEWNPVLLFVRRVLYWLFRRGIDVLPLLDHNCTNKRIIDAFQQKTYQILWLDRCLVVGTRTLEWVKKNAPGCLIVGFSHDDMAARHNQSKHFLQQLKHIDHFYTTKSYNVSELKALGCQRVIFLNNSFSPKHHYPYVSKSGIPIEKKYDVGFIGTWEMDRDKMFEVIVESGFTLHVWGSGWEKSSIKNQKLILHKEEVRGEEYAKALSSTKIALCMLRKMNRDVQTTRSVEIPACGTFMLGERTAEHLKLFTEGYEAEYFNSANELIAKLSFYINNPEKREEIAQAGYNRCIADGYSNEARLKLIFESISEFR